MAAVEKAFASHPGKIAAIFVEPVAANMGVVPPTQGFLKALREIATRSGALLIFDEVITGFRLCYGGAQKLFGVAPDLTILGKIIGGGLPVAAYGGPAEIMNRVAPLGNVYQAGTLSGNPLAMRAGIEMLRLCEAAGFYDVLGKRAARLAEGLRSAVAAAGVRGTSAIRGLADDAILCRRSQYAISPMRAAATRRGSADSFGRCSNAGCCSRHRSLRRSSYRPRIRMLISTRPSPQPARA